MNDPATYPPDAVDQLLADHLDRQGKQVDVELMLQRIRATHAAESPAMPSRRSVRWARWALGVAVAASLLVAVSFFWPSEQPLRASPQALLHETQKTLQQPVYRCYLVEVQRESNLADESNPFVSQAKQMRLWTRGDRFWIETSFPKMPNVRHYWGRDEQGTIWMTFGPREGVLIEASETPRWLTVYSDLCSMQPDRLIAEVLRDFELHREDGPAGSPVHIIKADLKPGRWHPGLKGAILELDAETKVLRRVVLQRMAGEGVNLTTTYTLVETKNQDEIQYPLDGREGKREFYTASYKPDQRQRLLFPLFGQRASEWMRPMSKFPMKK